MSMFERKKVLVSNIDILKCFFFYNIQLNLSDFPYLLVLIKKIGFINS